MIETKNIGNRIYGVSTKITNKFHVVQLQIENMGARVKSYFRMNGK